MAGTPTPNYQFPTYAETDTPNLAGAYNQAVNAIDAKIKEVADSIPSDVTVPDATSTTKGIAKLYDSTTIGDSAQEDGGVTPAAMKSYVDEKVPEEPQEYTAGTGILIEGTKISARGAYTVSSDTIDTVESTGLPADSPGTVVAACSESALVDRIVAVNDAEHKWPGGAVPTVQVLKDYVESKMAAAGAAYTGTAPVVVNNGSHTISVSGAQASTSTDGNNLTLGNRGVVDIIDTQSAYFAVKSHANDGQKPDWYVRAYNSAASVGLVINATPDASTTVKGLVKLTNAYNGSDTSMAVTGAAIKDIYNNSLTNITVDMLKNLYCDPNTGFVVYKAPTE